MSSPSVGSPHPSSINRTNNNKGQYYNKNNSNNNGSIVPCRRSKVLPQTFVKREKLRESYNCFSAVNKAKIDRCQSAPCSIVQPRFISKFKIDVALKSEVVGNSSNEESDGYEEKKSKSRSKNFSKNFTLFGKRDEEDPKAEGVFIVEERKFTGFKKDCPTTKKAISNPHRKLKSFLTSAPRNPFNFFKLGETKSCPSSSQLLPLKPKFPSQPTCLTNRNKRTKRKTQNCPNNFLLPKIHEPVDVFASGDYFKVEKTNHDLAKVRQKTNPCQVSIQVGSKVHQIHHENQKQFPEKRSNKIHRYSLIDNSRNSVTINIIDTATTKFVDANMQHLRQDFQNFSVRKSNRRDSRNASVSDRKDLHRGSRISERETAKRHRNEGESQKDHQEGDDSDHDHNDDNDTFVQLNSPESSHSTRGIGFREEVRLGNEDDGNQEKKCTGNDPWLDAGLSNENYTGQVECSHRAKVVPALTETTFPVSNYRICEKIAEMRQEIVTSQILPRLKALKLTTSDDEDRAIDESSNVDNSHGDGPDNLRYPDSGRSGWTIGRPEIEVSEKSVVFPKETKTAMGMLIKQTSSNKSRNH